MSVHETIKAQIKEAMLAKDALRLNVVRGIAAAFTNELVAKGRKPQGEVTDDEALAVIRRLVKQRKDSIEQFKAGGREDLAASETAELKILEIYLPAAISEADVRKIAEKKKAELGITDKNKAGLLMKTVMQELKGNADGAAVKKIVDDLLA